MDVNGYYKLSLLNLTIKEFRMCDITAISDDRATLGNTPGVLDSGIQYWIISSVVLAPQEDICVGDY